MVGKALALLAATAAAASVAAATPSNDPCAAMVGEAAMPPAQSAALAPWTAALGAAQPLVSTAAYPFCFLYGGKASSSLLPTWTFEAAIPRLLPDFTGRTVHSFTWSEPAAGASGSCCVVEVNVTLFAGQPTAADAVLGLSNTGSVPTAVVTRPGSLSAAWVAAPSAPVRLLTRVGGNGSPTDFYPAAPMPPALEPGAQPIVLQNQCGTGSFGTLPFFQVEWPQQRTGMLLSLGWSGQWLTTIGRNTSGAVTAWAGLGGQLCGGAKNDAARGLNDEYPRFSVVPGERLRLLRALTIAYSSKADAALHQTGLNHHRRIILDSIAPRAFQTPGRWPWNASAPAPSTLTGSTELVSDGSFEAVSPIYPLVAAISNKGGQAWNAGNLSDNLELLAAIREVPGEEEIWVDVGWQTGGSFGGNYAQPIQDSADEHWWPAGAGAAGGGGSLAPIFKAGHDVSGGKRNVQSVLWFMPEMNFNSSCDLGSWGKPSFPGQGCASRRRDCHSAASPSTFSRCFNSDVKGASAK